jgi:hypothetical protein
MVTIYSPERPVAHLYEALDRFTVIIEHIVAEVFIDIFPTKGLTREPGSTGRTKPRQRGDEMA